MPIKKLRSYLDKRHVKYVTISHSPSYTAQEIAASAHIPGKELAKTVMVRMDGEFAMAVTPASCKVDLEMLQAMTGKEVVLATEDDFKSEFPDCEVGAMPPFGNLYGMPVFVSLSLTEDEDIAFNAGTHTELIRMGYEDFNRLVKPTVLAFSTHA